MTTMVALQAELRALDIERLTNEGRAASMISPYVATALHWETGLYRVADRPWSAWARAPIGVFYGPLVEYPSGTCDCLPPF